jgi:predicted Zn-dependent protease
VAYVRYLGDLFWPRDLAVLYPLPSHWPLLTVLGAAALLAAITITAIALRRRMPWILTGWLWFLGTLVPVIGLVQVGAQSMADRYTYLPQIGLLLAGVMTINWMVRSRAAGLIIIGLALSIPLWIGTHSQTLVWRDSVTLYEHALAVTRDNWLVHNNLGVMAMDREQLDLAETHYREALRLHPEHAVVHGNLAEIVARRGNTTEAIRHLNEAIRLDPDNLAARNNLAWLLATARSPVVRNADRAVEIAQQVCADVDHESLDYPAYLDTLAAAYASAGRFDEAIATARKALELADPVRQVELRVQIDQNIQRYLNRQGPM